MANRYWVGGTNTWNDTAGSKWALTSGGAGGQTQPTSTDDVFFDGASGAVTVTFGAGSRDAKSVNFTGFTGTFAGGDSGLNCYGSFTLVSGMTLTWTGTLGIEATGTFTSGGLSIPFEVSIDVGTLTLGDNTVQTGSFNGNGFIFNGTANFNLNNKNLTTLKISGSGTTHVFTLGSGTLEITGAFDFPAIFSTLTANTSTIKFTNSSNTALTFAGNGKTYNNLWFARGASTGKLTITGTNTFADIKDTGTGTHTIEFPNVTTTITSWSISGTAGHLITCQRTGASGTWTVSDGAGTNSVDYLSISNSTATGGALFYAGANSTNGGGNTGWIFTPPSTNYPIVIGQGSFTLTGQTTLLHLGIKLLAVYGAFVLTGQTVLLKIGRKMISAFGSFTLSGQNVLLKISRGIIVAFGSFTLSGQSILFHSTIRMIASFGSFVLTGFASSLHKGYAILASMGTFTTTWFDILIHNTLSIPITFGSFVLTGQTTLLKVARKMIASVGNFALTGFNTLLHLGMKMLAGQGSFTLTGENILLVYGRKIVAGVGSFVLTGQSVLFHLAWKMSISFGSFVLTGQTILLRVGRKLTASVGSFVLTGKNILFHIAVKIYATYGSFVVTGFNIGVMLNGVARIWSALNPKHSASITNQTKHDETWNGLSKS